MKLLIIASALVLMLSQQNAIAKEWHGIIPLKSTRVDVERRFGRPDKWGDYEVKEERVSFRYAEGGPCRDLYLGLGKDNCKCLVDKDTVMAITVEPIVERRFSHLKLDLTRFSRTPIAPFPYTFAYYNPTEGIDYTVDESEDAIMTVEYYPSPVDCQHVISQRAPVYRNSWRGLIPLHANRRDVEQVVGTPQHKWGATIAYETDHEAISARYAEGNCTASSTEWNVPNDTLIELVVGQRLPFLLSRLNLDLERYERQEQPPLPETPNPPKVVNYTDRVAGIVIRAQSTSGGPEEVVSITYSPATKDQALRCHKDLKANAKH
jgi:hypothetical protein